MRGPAPHDILPIQPPSILENSETTRAYLDIRKKLLSGDYQTNQTISPKDIVNEYSTSNTSTQLILLRLAGEGLIRVLPTKDLAANDYRVADLKIRHRIFSTRHSAFVSDISRQCWQAHIETQTIDIRYADAEIASLLNITEGDKVIFHRTLQKTDTKTIVCIADTYLPIWFTEVLPELDKPDCDIYQLMLQLGKKPIWCTETIDIVQATSLEHRMFGLSPDDPSALLKILRRTFDENGNPLSVDFLTDRGDTYRLHYSFPLFTSGIPEKLRDK